jgi:RNA recognition motif-containing protein
MPIDFKNHGNLGYAFVNFHDVECAKKFQLHFNGFRLPMYQQSNKVLAVSEARVQGLTANVERFRNSSVMGVLNEEHKPMVFDKDGTQKEFPKPDGQLPAAGPRFRRPR